MTCSSRPCLTLYRDQCVYRKVWSLSVAGGCLGLPLGLLLLHGTCQRQSYLLSSVQILATGQSLFTLDPHHCSGRINVSVLRGEIVRHSAGQCGHCSLSVYPPPLSGHVDTGLPPIPGYLLSAENQKSKQNTTKVRPPKIFYSYCVHENTSPNVLIILSTINNSHAPCL